MSSKFDQHNHTQLPWILGGLPLLFAGRLVRGSYIVGAGGELIADLDNRNGRDRINAKRIVDCVNACEGIDNPAEYIAQLRKEREELLSMVNERGLF